MVTRPEVSVVMSVCNGARTLRATLASVLSQEGVEFEFIVVNDGSTDDTAAILAEYAAADRRLVVFEQANAGLTRALIRGCAAAQGEFIARQDAGGDVSLPGRFARQVAVLRADPGVALVSCGTRFVGPRGEHLYDVVQTSDELDRHLNAVDRGPVRGPSSHSSTLFRRSAYERAGGYQAAFYFAQDIDLWLRLWEVGRFATIPEVLYQMEVEPGSISGRYQREQRALARLAWQAARLRRAGASEAPALAQAARIRPAPNARTSRYRQAAALYFIGACLRGRDDRAARQYFRQAVRTCPWHLRAWFSVLSFKF